MSLIQPKPLTPEEKQEIIDEAIKQSVGKYGKPTKRTSKGSFLFPQFLTIPYPILLSLS